MLFGIKYKFFSVKISQCLFTFKMLIWSLILLKWKMFLKTKEKENQKISIIISFNMNSLVLINENYLAVIFNS